MKTNTKDTTAALSQLVTDITDIIKGYEVMGDRAEDDLRPIAQRLHALHQAHAADLMTELDEHGGQPDDSGSPMGLVHQAVVTGRDWFNALDTSAIPQIVEGEKRLLESYDEALKASESVPHLRARLNDQKAAIQAQIDALNQD